MGLAGAAEVYVTSTVRDLVAGSGAVFDDRGEHELKGVEGRRSVFALSALDTPLPRPLTPEQSTRRLALIQPSTTSPRLRIALAAGGIVLVGAAIAAGLLVLRGNAKAAQSPAFLRLDAGTRKVDPIVSVGPRNRGEWANLWSVDGTLWQFVGGSSPTPRLVARDLTTGAVKQSTTLPQGSCSCRLAFGFGSIWAAGSRLAVSGPNAGTSQTAVDRLDELSGRRLRSTPLSGGVDRGTIAAGNGAVWVLENDGTLVRIDPVTSRATNTYRTGAVETTTLIPLGGYEWICECAVNKVMRFDPRTGTSRTFDIPAQAYLIGVDSLHGQTMWLLDSESATLTALDPSTGRTQPPLGLGGNPQQAVVAFGAVWVAAGRVIDRLDLATRARSVIQMPRGVWAGSIAADPAGRSIWIGNSGSAPPAS
jgi:streptogramin lyase